MNRKINSSLLGIGLFCVSLSIISRQFIDSSAISEFISGFLIGLGLCFEFAGVLNMKNNKLLEKIKNFKKGDKM